MPHEIADSDGESDFGSPQRPSISPIHENALEAQPSSTLDQDPFTNLEFDQFLSPTQRLSSMLSSNDNFLRNISQNDPELTDSANNSHGLDGSIDQSSTVPPRKKPKRTLTDIEGGQTKSNSSFEFAPRSAKRTKTYGASRSLIPDSSPLFADAIDLQKPREHEVLNNGARSRNEANSNELPVQQLVDPEKSVESEFLHQTYSHGPNHTYQQQQVHTTFLQGNIQNSFMSKSSVGGYSGINLDFRGAGVGLDANANPFGSLSQVSLEGDTNPSQTERFASLFRHNRRLSDDGFIEERLDTTEFPEKGHFKEMATSPMQKKHISKEDLMEDTVELQSDREIPVAPVVPLQTTSDSRMSAGADFSAKPAPQKRGRKPKTALSNAGISEVQLDAFEQLQTEDPLDIPTEQYKPRPSRSRANTVDSTDSHFSQATQGASRKGKRSAVSESGPATKDQHMSSELILSDPALIGVPKEMYVPRPSKSRQKRKLDEDDGDELQEEHEARPYVTGRKAQTEPQAHFDITVPMPSATMKKKSVKKSKVKRAKTSAAALLQSAVMYDEDDKDCIIVDELPAKVKMAPLPQISPIKQEIEAKPEDTAVDESPDVDSLSAIKLSVDIPVLAPQEPSETPTSLPEPKKRGRKPKKKPDVHIEEEANIQEAPNPLPLPSTNNIASTHDLLHNQPDSRIALSPKDPNTGSIHPSPPLSTTLKPTPTPSPQKPVHSPLRPTLLRPASSTSISTTKIKPRVGLSKRTSIPSLLRKLDRTKEPPKVHERKEKLTKRQAEEEEKRRLEAEDAGEVYVDKWDLRGKDGMLIEWDE